MSVEKAKREQKRLEEAIADAYNLDMDDPDDAQAAHDTAMGESGFEDSVRRAVRKIEELEADEKALKDLENKYAERRKRLSEKKQKLRDSLTDAMMELGEDKMTLPEATVFTKTSPPSVSVTDPDSVPERFTVVEIKVDKSKIKSALKNGDNIPGAQLNNQPPSLTIRQK